MAVLPGYVRIDVRHGGPVRERLLQSQPVLYGGTDGRADGDHRAAAHGRHVSEPETQCGIRQQTAITDRQFLKSMIPHHAGAILMCRQNLLQDPELQRLCGKIVSSQQAEIDFMESKPD